MATANSYIAKSCDHARYKTELSLRNSAIFVSILFAFYIIFYQIHTFKRIALREHTSWTYGYKLNTLQKDFPA